MKAIFAGAASSLAVILFSGMVQAACTDYTGFYTYTKSKPFLCVELTQNACAGLITNSLNDDGSTELTTLTASAGDQDLPGTPANIKLNIEFNPDGNLFLSVKDVTAQQVLATSLFTLDEATKNLVIINQQYGKSEMTTFIKQADLATCKKAVGL